MGENPAPIEFAIEFQLSRILEDTVAIKFWGATVGTPWVRIRFRFSSEYGP